MNVIVPAVLVRVRVQMDALRIVFFDFNSAVIDITMGLCALCQMVEHEGKFPKTIIKFCALCCSKPDSKNIINHMQVGACSAHRSDWLTVTRVHSAHMIACGHACGAVLRILLRRGISARDCKRSGNQEDKTKTRVDKIAVQRRRQNQVSFSRFKHINIFHLCRHPKA